MAIRGSDPETCIIRTTVVSMALQALVGRLLADGVLDQGAMVAMREIGMQLAADLGDQPGMRKPSTRMADEVEAWWSAAGALGGR